MDFWKLFLIAVALAMDASAVALGIGFAFKRISFRPVFRLSLHFGVFQAFMPIIGWMAGSTVVSHIEAYDHWVAFALLSYVGIHMIRSGLREDDAPIITKDPTRGSSLVMLSFATSIDALAVGLSLGMLRVSIWGPSLIIGLVAAAATIMGMLLGNRFGAALGRRMDLLGGALLIVIGAQIAYSHIV